MDRVSVKVQYEKLYTKRYRMYDLRWGLMGEGVIRYSDNPKDVLYGLGYFNVTRNTTNTGDIVVEHVKSGRRYFYNADFIARKELMV